VTHKTSSQRADARLRLAILLLSYVESAPEGGGEEESDADRKKQSEMDRAISDLMDMLGEQQNHAQSADEHDPKSNDRSSPKPNDGKLPRPTSGHRLNTTETPTGEPKKKDD
jgi:hypothetical protein